MHAIFRDGGRQYRVEEGETLFLDYREADAGSTLQFSEVLAIEPGSGDFVCGTPLVDGASVEAEVIGEVKGPKVTSTVSVVARIPTAAKAIARSTSRFASARSPARDFQWVTATPHQL